MKHEFHFVLNEDLYLKLKKLSKGLNKNLSTTMVFIIERSNTFIERNHLKSKEEGSKFKIIANLEQKRFHVHCYLTEQQYRRLKQIHSDLNTYSLAQSIRKILCYFLMECFKYGIRDLRKRLDRIKKIWEEKKLNYRNEKQKFIKQMSYNFRDLQYCMTIYDQYFQPCMIQLL